MKIASMQRIAVQLRQLAEAQTDRQLLDRFLNLNEERAFAELVRRHGPMVFATCRRVLGHQQDAEDAFQAAFLVLARKAASVRHAESIAGWLFQVAHRLALRARMRKHRPTEQLTVMVEPPAPQDEPACLRRELQAELDKALAALPEHYRTTVVLCYLEGKTQADAARQLATTPATINSRLKRARLLLASHLKRRGVTSSVAALTGLLSVRQAGATSLPTSLLEQTSTAALGFRAGSSVCGASPRAISLAQGALRAMWHQPLKVLGGLLLLALFVGAAWLPAAVGKHGQPGKPAPAGSASSSAAALPLTAGSGLQREPKEQPMHVIILWMAGGPSQFETFDPKPGHINGGGIKAIPTRIPDTKFAEFLPQLARTANHLAVLRSVTHGEGDHFRATYLMHAGYAYDGQTFYPAVGAVLGKELGADQSDLLRYIVINWDKSVQQNAVGPGFLGKKYGPVFADAPDAAMAIDKVAPPRVPPEEAFPADTKEKAAAMRKQVVKAFDVGEEKRELRETYGLTPFGQSCLLARRLVEAGVPVVEITLSGWDAHANTTKLAEKACGTLDPAFATLLIDLQNKKLLDSTLIVCMGEFGRTPKINAASGRDHWPLSFSVVLAGAKIKGGQAIGATKDDGVGVAKRAISVAELHATIYQAVGVDLTRQFQSNLGQQVRIVPTGTKAVAEALK